MKIVMKSLNSKSGFGLVTLMVAMVIMTSFILMTVQATVGALKAVQYARIKTEVEDLRNYLRVSVDCSKTQQTAAAVAVNDYVSLNGKNGNPVIMAAAGGIFTRVGDYFLRAQKINPTEPVYKVEWTRDQSEWKEMFPVTKFACPTPNSANGSH